MWNDALTQLLGEGTWIETKTTDGQAVSVLFYSRALTDLEKKNLEAYLLRLMDHPITQFRTHPLSYVDAQPHHNED